MFRSTGLSLRGESVFDCRISANITSTDTRVCVRYDGQAGVASITLADQNEGVERVLAADLYASLRRQGLTAYQAPRLVRFTKQYVSKPYPFLPSFPFSQLVSSKELIIYPISESTPAPHSSTRKKF